MNYTDEQKAKIFSITAGVGRAPENTNPLPPEFNLEAGSFASNPNTATGNPDNQATPSGHIGSAAIASMHPGNSGANIHRLGRTAANLGRPPIPPTELFPRAETSNLESPLGDVVDLRPFMPTLKAPQNAASEASDTARTTGVESNNATGSTDEPESAKKKFYHDGKPSDFYSAILKQRQKAAMSRGQKNAA